MKENTLGGILIVLTIIISLSIFAYIVTLPATVTYTPVYSLGDGSQIHGSFVFGSGEINMESVYFYYAPLEYGGYMKFHIPADHTAIFMDQSANPFLKTTTYLGQSQYELHIPPGSIEKQYDLGVTS